MSATKFKGLMFLVSGVIMAVCCFFPIQTCTAFLSDGSKEVSVVSLIPSMQGLLLFMLSCVCIILPLVGVQSKSPLMGTITGIAAGAILMYVNIKPNRGEEEIIDTTIRAFYHKPIVMSTQYANAYGFYLIIIAALIVVFMGFVYGLAEPDD